MVARETLLGFARAGRDWTPLRELVARWAPDVVAAGLTGWDGADLGVPMIATNDAVTAHLGALGGEPGAVIVATAGLWAALGGQAVIADALDTGALIGGGWISILSFGAAAGAMLALALRTVRRAFRLRAPDLVVRIEEIVHQGARLAAPPLVRPARSTRDRAPPALA